MAKHFQDAHQDNMYVMDDGLRQKREWFRAAVDKWEDWRDAAQEDVEFVSGQQWKSEDKRVLEKAGRPAITINKIKQISIFITEGFNKRHCRFLRQGIQRIG